MATTVSSAERNAMFRTLLFTHTHERASAGLLKLADEKLVKAIKTGRYAYDASGDPDFQKLLRRWEIIPSSRKKDFDAKLESLTGGRGVPKETLPTWALETKGLYAGW